MPPEKSEKSKGGIKFGFIPAAIEYFGLLKNLPDRVESDGEVYNAQKRFEEMDQNSALSDPAVKMHTEDEVEDLIQKNKGFYGVISGADYR